MSAERPLPIIEALFVALSACSAVVTVNPADAPRLRATAIRTGAPLEVYTSPAVPAGRAIVGRAA